MYISSYNVIKDGEKVVLLISSEVTYLEAYG